jgi:hypothetical protein
MHKERCRERRTLVTLSRTLGFVRWGDCVHGASVLVTFSKHLEREREREREKGGTQWVCSVGLIFVSARKNKRQRHHHRTNFIGETVSITSSAFQWRVQKAMETLWMLKVQSFAKGIEHGVLLQYRILYCES